MTLLKSASSTSTGSSIGSTDRPDISAGVGFVARNTAVIRAQNILPDHLEVLENSVVGVGVRSRSEDESHLGIEVGYRAFSN